MVEQKSETTLNEQLFKPFQTAVLTFWSKEIKKFSTNSGPTKEKYM